MSTLTITDAKMSGDATRHTAHAWPVPDEPTLMQVKQCTKCNETKPLEEFYRDRSKTDGRSTRCRSCVREAERRRREANPEPHREASRRWREANREADQEKSRRWHEANREASRENKRRLREAHREAVLDHYGRECACCGATVDLTIDHVNGDGREHRLQLFGRVQGTSGMYWWLIKNGFPVGLQTLCFSCNRSKRDGQRCRLNHAKAAL